jgi:hypothetical protein
MVLVQAFAAQIGLFTSFDQHVAEDEEALISRGSAMAQNGSAAPRAVRSGGILEHWRTQARMTPHAASVIAGIHACTTQAGQRQRVRMLLGH